MSKKKCTWKCGTCNDAVLISKKGKKMKYLYCPTCKKLAAYYNFDILGALGSVAKSVVRSIPVVGGLASGLIDVAEEAITPSPSSYPSGAPSAAPQMIVKAPRQSSTQKMKDIDELLRRK